MEPADTASTAADFSGQFQSGTMHFHLPPSGGKANANDSDPTGWTDDTAQSDIFEDGAKTRVGSFLLIDSDIKLPFTNIDWTKHTDPIFELARHQQHGETKLRILELLSQTSPDFISALLDGRGFPVDSKDGLVTPLEALRDLGILSREEIFTSLDPVERRILPVSFVFTTAICFVFLLSEDEGGLTLGEFLGTTGLALLTAIIPSFVLGIIVYIALHAYRTLMVIEAPGKTTYTYSLKEDGRTFVQEDFYPAVAKYIKNEGI